MDRERFFKSIEGYFWLKNNKIIKVSDPEGAPSGVV